MYHLWPNFDARASSSSLLGNLWLDRPCEFDLFIVSLNDLTDCWYSKFNGFPRDASLFRPIEFGCPPGIHALWLIKGLRLTFLELGDIDVRELYWPTILDDGFRGTDSYWRPGIAYSGLYAVFFLGGSFGSGYLCNAYYARITASLALVFGFALLTYSIDWRWPRSGILWFDRDLLLNLPGGGCWSDKPTIVLGFFLLIGPLLTISGSFSTKCGLIRCGSPWLSRRTTPRLDFALGEIIVPTDFIDTYLGESLTAMLLYCSCFRPDCFLSYPI